MRASSALWKSASARFLWTILTAVCAVYAQDYRGRVQGVVTDSTNARVAGAKIVLTNVRTSVAAVKSSSATGQYLFDYVDPGTYTVTAEMQGFSQFVQQNVEVQVRGDVTVNIQLQLGATSQSLVVSDTPPAVQFNTGTMELNVDQKTINDVPVLGRNPYLLATLDPAVVLEYGNMNSSAPYRMWYGSSMDVGGNTSQKNELLLDGTPSQVGAKASYQPPMDAVQEFTVQQNAVDAEFGHSAGGTLSVSMKSGTNDLHGTLYYFGRNPLLNAVSNATVRTPNMVHNHIWGTSAGGPVKKHKLFAFFVYEGWRYATPQSTSMTLPTELERTGDFSRSLNTNGALRTIYDPFTTTYDASTGAVGRQTFAGNVIPKTRIDSTASRMLQDIWLPNRPGDGPTGTLNYRMAYPWLNRYYNISNRMDWNISDRWKIFGRYSQFNTRLLQPDFARSRAVYNPVDGVMNSRNVVMDSVYTLNPKMVLNVRMSYTALNDSYDSPATALTADEYAALWGGNAWFKPYLPDQPALYYPYLNFSSGATFGRDTYWIQHPHTSSLFARLSRQQGAHYLKIGTDERFTRSNAVRPRLLNLYFRADDTANTFRSPNTRLSGDPFASFLLGVMNDSRSVAQDIPVQHPRVNDYAIYFQDDFKLHRRITLNLGLRYEYEPGPYDPDNRLSRYLDLDSPIPEMQVTPPKIPADVAAMMGKPYRFTGAWVFTDSSHRNMWQSDPRVLLPRVGAAIRLTGGSALRIGFARYVAPPITGTDMLGSMSYPGFSAATYVAATLQGVPGAVLSNLFPSTNPLILPAGKSLGRYTNLGGSATWDQQKMRTATNDRLNVTLQRQLPARFVGEITFFENFGRNWSYTLYPNMMDPQTSYTYKTALDRSIANPFYNYLTADKFPGQLRNQANVSVRTLLVPYPQYGTLTQTNTSGGRDRYRSLKLKFQRRHFNGFNLLAAYNYGNEIQTGFFNSDDQYAGKFTWMPSSMPRHRLNASGTYDLPFGKGRRFLTGGRTLSQAVLGGWAVSGIFNYVSGRFLQFGQYTVNGDPRIDNPTRERWFNTSVFSFAPSYTPRTNPRQYEGLTGPRRVNADMTLMKSFPVRDRYRLEFRIEAYNVTNSFMASDPSVSLSDANFGKSTGQANQGRSVQYCLKLYF